MRIAAASVVWLALVACGEVRDDRTYEVIDSPWLTRQAHLQGAHAPDFAHYKLCFNAAGALDVLCRRI